MVWNLITNAKWTWKEPECGGPCIPIALFHPENDVTVLLNLQFKKKMNVSRYVRFSAFFFLFFILYADCTRAIFRVNDSDVNMDKAITGMWK